MQKCYINGRNLRGLRKEAKLSQADLGELAGSFLGDIIDHSTISKYETKQDNHLYVNIEAIVKALSQKIDKGFHEILDELEVEIIEDKSDALSDSEKDTQKQLVAPKKYLSYLETLNWYKARKTTHRRILLVALIILPFVFLFSLYYFQKNQLSLLNQGKLEPGISLTDSGNYKEAHDFYTDLKNSYSEKHHAELDQYLDNISLKRLKLAYIQNDSIFIISADGSKRIFLSEGNHLKWSPDGKYLAFTKTNNFTDKLNDMYLFDTLTSVKYKLCSSVSLNSDFFWSPDSKKIVYVHDYSRWYFAELLMIDVKGKDRERLHKVTGNYYDNYTDLHSNYDQIVLSDLKWSPDSTMIAYISRLTSSFMDQDIVNVSCYHLRGGSKCALSVKSAKSSLSDKLHWISNKEFIFSFETTLLNSSIFYKYNIGTNSLFNDLFFDKMYYWYKNNYALYDYRFDRFSNEIYKYYFEENKSVRLTNNQIDDTNAIGSNDGEKIVFASDENGYNEIYIMNENGTDRERITDMSMQFIKIFEWLAIDSKIAFTWQQNQNPLYITDINTKQTIKIAENILEPHFSPALIDKEFVIQ